MVFPLTLFSQTCRDIRVSNPTTIITFAAAPPVLTPFVRYQGMVTEWNRKSAEMLGYTKEESESDKWGQH